MADEGERPGILATVLQPGWDAAEVSSVVVVVVMVLMMMMVVVVDIMVVVE